MPILAPRIHLTTKVILMTCHLEHNVVSKFVHKRLPEAG